MEPKTFSKKAKPNVSLYSSNLNSLNINFYDLIFRPKKKKKTFAKEIYSYIFINLCSFSPLNAPKINDLYMTKSQYKRKIDGGKNLQINLCNLLFLGIYL